MYPFISGCNRKHSQEKSYWYGQHASLKHGSMEKLIFDDLKRIAIGLLSEQNFSIFYIVFPYFTNLMWFNRFAAPFVCSPELVTDISQGLFNFLIGKPAFNPPCCDGLREDIPASFFCCRTDLRYGLFELGFGNMEFGSHALQIFTVDHLLPWLLIRIFFVQRPLQDFNGFFFGVRVHQLISFYGYKAEYTNKNDGLFQFYQ